MAENSNAGNQVRQAARDEKEHVTVRLAPVTYIFQTTTLICRADRHM